MHILIVENNPGIRWILEAQIDLLGHKYQVVADSTEALSILEKSEAFDLVISDIKMKYIDGMPLADKLKAIDPQLVVLVTRSYSNCEITLVPQGADGCLDKPFSFNALKRAITCALRTSTFYSNH